MHVTTESQLRILHSNLKAISDDIGQLEDPVGELYQLLDDLSTALNTPQKISKDLKFIGETLSVLEGLASDITWMPEIGSAAEAVERVLRLLVKSTPPGGAIGEMRAALGEIDTTLAPVKDQLKKIQDPINKAYNAIDKVHGKVNLFVHGTQSLIQRYGNEPPENVEKCAGQLNAGMAKIASDFDTAKDAVVQHAQGFLSALGKVETEFHRIEGYVTTVQNVFNTLEGSAYKKALRDIKRLKNKADGFSHAVFKIIMKTLGIDLGALQRFLNKMEGRIESFVRQAIDKVLNKMKAEIEKEVAGIPALDGLREEAANVESALEAARSVRRFILLIALAARGCGAGPVHRPIPQCTGGGV